MNSQLEIRQYRLIEPTLVYLDLECEPNLANEAPDYGDASGVSVVRVLLLLHPGLGQTCLITKIDTFCWKPNTEHFVFGIIFVGLFSLQNYHSVLKHYPYIIFIRIIFYEQ